MASKGYRRALVVSCLLLALHRTQGVTAQTSAPAAPDPATYPLLREFAWRSIGPAGMGGRVDEIASVESDPRVFYIAYATGGLWKTTNAGTTFEPLLDRHTSHIGAVAVARSDPDVVWVGSGEANNRQSSSFGDGVYRSTDAGRTFADMGLNGTQSINRIVIHPEDPDIVYVAASGALYAANPERGVFRTADGGRSWERVLYVDDDTGATDLVMDPADSDVLYAATYQRRRTAWGFNGGGPGSGIWKTVDGGTSWTRLTGAGLPGGPMGRIALDVARSNPEVVYAQIEVLRDENRVARAPARAFPPGQAYRGLDDMGGVWRSVDRGVTWEFRSDNNVRPSYFSILRVDPNDENVVYTGGRLFYRSSDGGRTWETISGTGHVDTHAIWIDPADSDHLLIGNDGGADVSFDRGQTWESFQTMPVGQFYQVSVDMQRPYRVCGGLQDNGSWCGPSSTRSGFISNHDWFSVGGGDGFYTAIDPSDPAIVYSEAQRGGIRRLDLHTGVATPIQPLEANGENGASNVVPDPPVGEIFRWNWNTPFILSRHNPRVLYLGANRLFKSVDRGDTWTMGPDVTRRIDPSKLEIMGVPGTAPDCHGNDGPVAHGERCILSKNDGTWFFSTITTIAESPLLPDVIWVGTDDGNVQVSRDGNATWTDVTPDMPDAPRDCYVSRVEASYAAVGIAFASFDCHRNGDYRPYVYVTADHGATWSPIVDGLPPFGSVKVVKADPRNPRLLYAGTEFGFYVSLDGGSTWNAFMNGLPVVRVDDVVVHPREGDLVLATHGRSVYVLDDVTPLQQLTPGILESDVHLFHPRPAVSWRRDPTQARALPGGKHFHGANPEPGVAIHYYLGAPAAEGHVGITVTDPVSGEVFRELRGPGGSGLHRVRWDLRGDPVAPRQEGRVAEPGVYRVTLRVDGRSYDRVLSVEDDVWTGTR